MITDATGMPRYYDKSYVEHIKPPSPELRQLYREMQANPRYHIATRKLVLSKRVSDHSHPDGHLDDYGLRRRTKA